MWIVSRFKCQKDAWQIPVIYCRRVVSSQSCLFLVMDSRHVARGLWAWENSTTQGRPPVNISSFRSASKMSPWTESLIGVRTSYLCAIIPALPFSVWVYKHTKIRRITSDRWYEERIRHSMLFQPAEVCLLQLLRRTTPLWCPMSKQVLGPWLRIKADFQRLGKATN